MSPSYGISHGVSMALKVVQEVGAEKLDGIFSSFSAQIKSQSGIFPVRHSIHPRGLLMTHLDHCTPLHLCTSAPVCTTIVPHSCLSCDCSPRLHLALGPHLLVPEPRSSPVCLAVAAVLVPRSHPPSQRRVDPGTLHAVDLGLWLPADCDEF